MTDFGTGFRIKVSTEQLIRAADSVNVIINEMRAAYDEMNSIVSGTSYYWRGTAGDAKRKMYYDKRETAEQLLKFLSPYPTDLLKMAGVYAESEAANVQLPASLSSDIII